MTSPPNATPSESLSTHHPSPYSVEHNSSYRRRVHDFLQLHEQVQTSVNLLDSLESFLSTFKKDLSAVSGQISELQDRSKAIENRLKARRRIEKPLSSLLADITIPPALATLILDSHVGEPWIEGIEDFERRLVTIKARSRVKAARDLSEVAEGLRIVAATKLRAFFLALFEPIRSNVTTNMQVIQTSVLLKYNGFFAFLQRQAPDVAHEVQRSYVGAARVYYETGFRRYARSLTLIKARFVEKHENIVVSEREKDLQVDLERLAFAKIVGPGVTLAYMADDKSHKEPIEALLRSLLLVFLDNATSEYTFVKTFFSVEASLPTKESSNSILSPSLQSPDRATFADQRSVAESDYGGQRVVSPGIVNSLSAAETASKEEQAGTDALWKQVMDPVMTYCESFLKSTLDPIPPAVPLLTMIRLMEDVVVEVQKRNCPPVEFYVFALRLQMWPVFQKAMAENVDALKKLAEGGSSGYFSRAIATSDAGVSSICKRYTIMFSSFIQLTEQEEETMIFANLLRLRQELTKLILRHTNSITDVVKRATALLSIYDSLLQGLSKDTLSAHPKSQQEIAYWANLHEEAKRKIVSASRQLQR
ncbi:Vacuolar protein sorting-associated protein 52 like protein [Termitomyces sp. T112]|nr:Vacuolar protein sorting-associated protein 52 like protein [Termitomyces sp. T112]